MQNQKDCASDSYFYTMAVPKHVNFVILMATSMHTDVTGDLFMRFV